MIKKAPYKLMSENDNSWFIGMLDAGKRSVNGLVKY